MPSPGRAAIVWSALALAVGLPLILALQSPLLAWRQPVYIAAGLFGILAMALLLVQPLLIGGYLPGLRPVSARRIHRWTGAALVAWVALHVLGLWITSPPDVVDVLLLRSPTPFSFWGLAAMWTIFLAAFLALLRRRLRLSPAQWRSAHKALAAVSVTGSVVHAMLIEGTMEMLSKTALCGLVLIATARVLADPGRQ